MSAVFEERKNVERKRERVKDEKREREKTFKVVREQRGKESPTGNLPGV